ncbi:MAG TPA: hypothetical protein VFX59_17965 [Polyangiales bacterium]|nr:hypothetical protein [Polyangiales bacterium]
MNTRTCLALIGAGLLAAATTVPASAQPTPVSRQKNVELNSVKINQGNYDSPPASAPVTFSALGYETCLVALGTTYCRTTDGHWNAMID